MNEPAPPRRVYVAGLSHETNSFSPMPTAIRNFEQDVCYRPTDPARREPALAFPGYGDAVSVVRDHGDLVIEGPFFWTQPSGPMPIALYESLCGDILSGLAAAGPVDMVVLNLHGAMMARGLSDCEGDLLARMRAQLGWAVPVGALLDLHGNVSPRMIESGAILIGVKEYPHIDYRERAEELYRVLCDMAAGAAHPVTTLLPVPVLSLQGTTEQPMRGLVDDLQQYERLDGILSVTLMHGFPWADGEHTGASVLVVSDGDREGAVLALAEEIASRFTDIVAGQPVERLGVTQAVDEALATSPGSGPVMIADSSDNPGGGAACDSTFLLQELVKRDVRNVAVGMIWDPQAATLAADAGVGACLPIRIGGKVGPMSGDPIDLDVEVLNVRSDARQRVFSDEPNDPLGLAVLLRAGGIEIVVNSHRQQVFSTECFSEMGVDLAAKSLVVVKSSQHFRASFDRLSRRTIYCDGPGTLTTDLEHLPYRSLGVTRRGAMFAVDRPVMASRFPKAGSNS
ncbi:M81 family metallopeptidase [Sphingomonas oryzagri]